MLLNELKNIDIISTFPQDHINLLLGDIDHQIEQGKSFSDAVEFVVDMDPDFEHINKSKVITSLTKLYKDRK